MTTSRHFSLLSANPYKVADIRAFYNLRKKPESSPCETHSQREAKSQRYIRPNSQLPLLSKIQPVMSTATMPELAICTQNAAKTVVEHWNSQCMIWSLNTPPTAPCSFHDNIQSSAARTSKLRNLGSQGFGSKPRIWGPRTSS